MAASATDKFRKLARRWVGQIGAGGVADDSVTTVPLASSTNLATDTGIDLVIDRVDSDGDSTATLEETIVGVVSGNNIATVARGEEGTAQAHSAGAVVENLFTANAWNDVVDGILVEHAQDGTHGAITSDSVTAKTTNGDLTLDGNGTGKVNLNADDINLGGTTPNIQVGDADPWRTISIFGGLAPTTTSGCASSATVEAGTNDIDYKVLDFDNTSDESAFINFSMPDSWDAGVIQFRYVWTTASGGAAETVTIELSGRSFADNDAIDQAVGTAVEVADTWIADGDIHISAWSGDVTLAGTPAAGEYVHLELMRDVSEDDLGGDARLIELQIRYKQAKFGD